jgi:DNA-binding MarR family transcriptional regulator
MPGFSLPEFRALNYLSQYPEASLNVVAEHLGLTPPTASKLVQKLVTDGVVARKGATDRRRVCLSLTESGNAALSAARVETRQQLAECLGSLNQKELNAVSMALKALGRAFSQGGVNVNLS